MFRGLILGIVKETIVLLLLQSVVKLITNCKALYWPVQQITCSRLKNRASGC